MLKKMCRPNTVQFYLIPTGFKKIFAHNPALTELLEASSFLKCENVFDT